jgi:hypothetical protein
VDEFEADRKIKILHTLLVFQVNFSEVYRSEKLGILYNFKFLDIKCITFHEETYQPSDAYMY